MFLIISIHNESIQLLSRRGMFTDGTDQLSGSRRFPGFILFGTAVNSYRTISNEWNLAAIGRSDRVRARGNIRQPLIIGTYPRGVTRV